MRYFRLQVLAVFVFLLNSAFSQIVFCPPGAVWTAYFRNTIFSTSTVNSSIVYSGDSISGSDTIKILTHSKFFKMCNSFSSLRSFIRKRGDTVFLWNKFTLNTWQVLFNYGCTAGGGWSTTYSVPGITGSKTLSVTVDSVGSSLQNGFQLKRLFVTVNSFKDTITERYGSGFLFNFSGRYNCDGDIFMGSLCYSDNQFGTKYFSNYQSCVYINPTEIEEKSLEGTVGVSPNPVGSSFQLTGISPDTPVLLRISDQMGKVILSEEVYLNQKIDLSFLDPGLFILTYYYNDKSNSWKLIKAGND
jgi:hypothetical protein